ncbi:MAG TPA: amylo-alpha-1,6-glucosidase, partial [Chitinophagaceae bacterium]
MKLRKEQHELNDITNAVKHEWLETNGLGGWSASTLTGCNTRRYHGLLIAATLPPAERMALVSKLDETIIIDERRYELGVNFYRGDTIYPEGHQYLRSFNRNLFPEWIYEVNGILLKKTIAMIHGQNTVVIVYDILQSTQPFTMELLPLLSVRGYHNLMYSNNAVNRKAEFVNDVFRTKLYDNTPEIFIKIPQGSFKNEPDWYFNFNYPVEHYRGLEFEEDLFNPGKLFLEMQQGGSAGIIISDTDPSGMDAHELLAKETKRREALLTDAQDDDITRILTLAADQFIVKREDSLKTVIAGYHWFTDWGRDTMISLPGLCLSTGRHEDARKILAAFANSVSQGMLPNRFQDNGAAPEYNNVDGTLWYFIAVYKYLLATDDRLFVINKILPVLKDIISWHRKGTRYHIHETEDGLLYSGEEKVQLTWMDAKVGDWVVTPRTGKAVEVNALWYNALNIYAYLLKLNNEDDTAKEVIGDVEKIRENFTKLFWNEEGGYLYDVIGDDFNDDAFRPNQLFAIGLPFPLIKGAKAKKILKLVSEKLYTPVGLRSISRDDPSYVGKYGGDAFHRDAAYHQGTAWSWLLGIYIDAIMKAGGKEGREQGIEIISNFASHLNEACIGSVSEIYDGDEPYHPRGCVAQAWGVAEILRVIKDHGLY